MNDEPLVSGATRPEKPPSLNPFWSTGASSRRTSATTVATDTDGLVDGGRAAAVLPAVDAALAVVPVVGPAALAVAPLDAAAVVDAALAETAGGWAIATVAPAGSGSGSGTGARASIASSRADICT